MPGWFTDRGSAAALPQQAQQGQGWFGERGSTPAPPGQPAPSGGPAYPYVTNTAVDTRRRSILERFDDNFRDAATRGTLSGGLGQVGAVGVAAQIERDTGRRGVVADVRNTMATDAETYQLRSEGDPWFRAPDPVAAGIATLGGQIAGSLISPESYVGGAAKTLAGKVATNAGVNAALDVPIQGLNMVGGSREGYSPTQTVLAGGLGAALPVGAEALGRVGRVVLDRIRGGRAPDGEPTIRPGAPEVSPSPPGERRGWFGNRGTAAPEPAPPAPTAAAPSPTPRRPRPPKPATPQGVAGPIGDIIAREAQAAGVDPAVASRIAQIESGGNASAQNGGSSAGGLFQFTDRTWRAMGGGDKMDPETNARRGAAFIAQNTAALRAQLGRDPTPAEIYLAHGNGAEGASALLTADRGASAIDILTAANGGNRRLARRAVLGNKGTEGTTVGEFIDFWQGRYNGAAPGSSTVGPRTLTPEQEAEIAARFGTDTLRDPTPTTTAGPGGAAPGGEIITENGAPAAPAGPLGFLEQAPALPERAGLVETLRTQTGGEPVAVVGSRREATNGGHLEFDLNDGSSVRLTRIPDAPEEAWRIHDPLSTSPPDGASDGPFFKPGMSDADRVAEIARTVEAGRARTLREQRAQSDFPGDRIASSGEAAKPSQAPAPVRDLTDEALDVIRGKTRLSDDRGPSLLQWLANKGGVNDVGGDLARLDAQLWHKDRPFQRRFINETGMSPDAAAEAAWEAGYLGARDQRIDPDAVTTGRPTTNDLFEVIRRELAGEPTFARESERSQELGQYVRDLDEIFSSAGLDPTHLDNATARRALNDILAGRDVERYQPSSFDQRSYAARAPVDQPFAMRPPGDAPKTEQVRLADGTAEQGLIPGVEPVTPTQRAIAEETRRRLARRGFGQLPEGGLFDEVAKRQGDLFDAPPAPPPGKQGSLFMAAPKGGPAPEAPDLKTPGYHEATVGPTTISYGVNRAGFVEISRVRTDPAARGQGAAREAMNRFVTQADAAGARVGLTPEPMESGVSKARLQTFYRSLGFRPNTGRARDLTVSVAMVREPSQGVLGNTLSMLKAPVQAPGMPSKGVMPDSLRPGPTPTPAGQAPGIRNFKGGENITQIATRIREAMGLTQRQGRLTNRQALGEYRPKDGGIRTRHINDIEALSHEAGHFLDFSNVPGLTEVITRHQRELRPLDYDPARGDIREGFAEWFRRYVENPMAAEKKSPGFYAAFEDTLARERPRLLEDLRSVQEAYRRLVNTDAATVSAASVVTDGPRGPVRDFFTAAKKNPAGAFGALFDQIYKNVVDDLHFIKLAEDRLAATYRQNAGRKFNLDTANSPYELARLSRGSANAAMQDMQFGVVPFGKSVSEGPSMTDIGEKAFGKKELTGWSPKDVQDFGAYLTDRRAIRLWDRFARGEIPNEPTAFSREFHAQAIADFEKAHPTWREAAELVYAYNDALWRKERESGFLTEEAYTRGRDENPDYVPFQRDLSDLDNIFAESASVKGRATTGSMRFAGGAKRLVGSRRGVVNPLQSMMRRTFELNALIARNEAFKALDKFAQKAGRGSAAIAERIPLKEMKGTTVDAIEALEAAAKKAGVHPRDLTTLTEMADKVLGDKTEATIYRAGEMNPGSEPIVYVWRDGEKIPLRLSNGVFGRELFRALTGMNTVTKNLFVDLASAPTAVLRTGITMTPAYQIANVIRDQVSTAAMVPGFVPFGSAAKGAVADLTNAQVARRYNAAGGIRGGSGVAAMDKARVNKEFGAMNRRNRGVMRFASLRGLVHLTETSETASRLGAFGVMMRQAKREGLSDLAADKRAAFLARDVLDYDRRGGSEVMRTAARTVTFLNSAVQGLDKALRTATAEYQAPRLIFDAVAPIFNAKAERLTPREARTLKAAAWIWGMWTAAGALGAGLTSLYADDPEFQEISEYLRATHWVFKTGPDGEGKPHWVFIPKPFEHAWLSNVMERAYEGANGDPRWLQNMAADLGQVLVPPNEAPALAIPFEIARNRDSFGAPIVPESLQGVEPREQVTSRTTPLAQGIAGTLNRIPGVNVSPAMTDYLINAVGGTWGRDFGRASTAVSNAPMSYAPEDGFVSSRFVRYPARGSESANEFWRQVASDDGQLSRVANTVRALAQRGPQADEQITRYISGLPEQQRQYAIAALAPGQMGTKWYPLDRASKAVGVIGDVRREMADGRVMTLDGTTVDLNPRQRRAADEALAYYAMAEMRNALITTGVPGWQNKAPIPPEEVRSRLARISPQLAGALEARFAWAKVLPVEQNDAAWRDIQAAQGQLYGSEGASGLSAMRRRGSRDGRLMEIQP